MLAAQKSYDIFSHCLLRFNWIQIQSDSYLDISHNLINFWEDTIGENLNVFYFIPKTITSFINYQLLNTIHRVLTRPF